MTKEQIKEKAKDFVSKIAGGTSKEMDYYANILAEFATEVTKEAVESAKKKPFNNYHSKEEQELNLYNALTDYCDM